MEYITEFFYPFKNELVYSWIHRLSNANGISFRIFMETYMEKSMIFEGDFNYDIRHELVTLCDHIYCMVDLNRIYRNNTTQPFYNLFFTKDQGDRYTRNYVRTRSTIDPKMKGTISKIKICPRCLEEDKIKYLHTEHNLSGVTICAKHKCKLYEYVGKKGNECEYDINQYRECFFRVDEEFDLMYSIIASKLCLTEISADISHIKHFVKLRLKGYVTSDGYFDRKVFVKEIKKWKYSYLFNNIEYATERFFIKSMGYTPESIIPLIMFVFDEIDELINLLPKGENYFEYRTCEHCGQQGYFLIEDNAYESCYRCQKEIDTNKEFISLVKEKNSGEYEALDPFISMNREIRFLHKKCGKITKIKPRVFLYGTATCSCEKIAFDKGFEVFKAYKESNKLNEKIPKRYVWNGYKLGQWVSDTKKKASMGILADWQIELLSEYQFPFVWEDKRWETSFSVYKNYVEQTGNGHVKRSVIYNDFKLGEWYGNLKKSYSNGSLSEDRIKQIKALYPDFPSVPVEKKISKEKKPSSIMRVPFDKALNLLLDYETEMGTKNISKRAEYKGYKLGIWANQMRSKKKQGILPLEQIEKLDKIGFDWEPLKSKWNRDLERYSAYVMERGMVNPAKDVMFRNFAIGNWYSNLKVSYRNQSLSQQQIEEIRSINPDFMRNN